MLALSTFVCSANADMTLKSQIKSLETKEEAITAIENYGEPLTLFNYASNNNDDIQSPGNLAVEKGVEYVPPYEEFIDLYFDFIEKGSKPYEAVLMTYTSPEALEFIRMTKQEEQDRLSAENKPAH